MLRKILAVACVGLVILVVVNFITFVVRSESLGGDALSGHALDGHYYLSAKGHSTEVAESVWRQSRWHAISVVSSFPLGMLAMAYLLFRFIFARQLYRGDATAIAATELQVRAHALPVKQMRCGGRLGRLNFSRPLLNVAVYREGLWIKPIFMAPFAIPASDLSALEERTGWMSKGIEIAHRSTQVASPIRLFSGGDPALLSSLRSVVRQRH